MNKQMKILETDTGLFNVSDHAIDCIAKIARTLFLKIISFASGDDGLIQRRAI